MRKLIILMVFNQDPLPLLNKIWIAKIMKLSQKFEIENLFLNLSSLIRYIKPHTPISTPLYLAQTFLFQIRKSYPLFFAAKDTQFKSPN